MARLGTRLRGVKYSFYRLRKGKYMITPYFFIYILSKINPISTTLVIYLFHPATTYLKRSPYNILYVVKVKT